MDLQRVRLIFGLALLAAAGCGGKCPLEPPCPAPGFDTQTCECRQGGSADAGARVSVLLGGAGAPPDEYACGATASCDARTQTCEHVVGGAPPGVDDFHCIALPQACANDVSCTCLTEALRSRGGVQCSGDGSRLTVRIDVP